MDQIHLMNVFMAVGEEQGFAAAARRLELSPPAVTRAIAALEERLAVKLLARTTRNVRLTEAGQRYLDDTRSILASITEANLAASGINAAPKGKLSVSSSALFGRTFIMPCILRYLKAYPEVEVSALFHDRAVNLMDEGIDVAVRVGQLSDSRMKALRVGQVRRVLCASPAYLARHGVPHYPVDLLRHTIVAANGPSARADWTFGAADAPSMLRIRPRLTVTGNEAAIDAVVGGLGISRLLYYQVAAELKAGRLHAVLEDYEEAPWPVHVLHQESKYGSSKVRSFIDMLAAHLRGHDDLH